MPASSFRRVSIIFQRGTSLAITHWRPRTRLHLDEASFADKCLRRAYCFPSGVGRPLWLTTPRRRMICGRLVSHWRRANIVIIIRRALNGDRSFMTPSLGLYGENWSARRLCHQSSRVATVTRKSLVVKRCSLCVTRIFYVRWGALKRFDTTRVSLISYRHKLHRDSKGRERVG